MTEAGWLACEDSRAMVAFLRSQPRASPRVWRLFLAAFWDWQARYVAKSDRKQLRKRAGLLAEWAEAGKKPAGVTRDEEERFIGFRRLPSSSALRSTAGRTPAAVVHQLALLRDIFGNPFHPVRWKPSWRTSDVLLLARGIYEARAFDRMPILADALEEAGCADEQLLSHCRGSCSHVRGCWVIDLVLGNE